MSEAPLDELFNPEYWAMVMCKLEWRMQHGTWVKVPAK